jgi:hypothetical protein
MLNYPCIVFMNAGLLLVRSNKDGVVKILNIKKDIYLLDCAATPPNKVNFIIDSSGCFYIVHYKKFYNTWLSKISWLYDFVKAECLLEPKGNITIGELKSMLAAWYPGVDKHLGAANYFMKDLNKFPQEIVFDSDVLKSIYNL